MGHRVWVVRIASKIIRINVWIVLTIINFVINVLWDQAYKVTDVNSAKTQDVTIALKIQLFVKLVIMVTGEDNQVVKNAVNKIVGDVISM